MDLKEQFICILIGLVIGVLFGLGFADWGTKSPDSLTDWLIASGTLLLVFIAILGAISWKKQRIPEAAKDCIHAIVEFDNHIYQFGNKDFVTDATQFKDYHQNLLIKLWNIEKAIMFFYQFDSSKKEIIDAEYNKILNKVNKFGQNLIIRSGYNSSSPYELRGSKSELNKELEEALRDSYSLLQSIVGKNLTIKH